MTKDDIVKLAIEHTVSGLKFDEDGLVRFAKLIEDRAYAKQLELPEPRLTGKFSITMGKFKCTGCTGLWDSREDAKHHSCRDYQ
jgi:hypothetical protein